MDETTIKNRLNQAIEQLASIEHERWSHWQRFVHNEGTRHSDGSLTIPAEVVDRWEKQISTPYYLLTDDEKKSDREQVQKYLPTIIKALL